MAPTTSAPWAVGASLEAQPDGDDYQRADARQAGKHHNSTLSGNAVSAGDGGGLYNETDLLPSRISLNSSTVSGNSASGLGGGIYNELSGVAAEVHLFNVTVAFNSAGGAGAGIANNAGLVRVHNSIVGQQLPGGSGCASAAGGSIVGVGTNLEEGVSCGFSINSVFPGLDPLAVNAPGNTETHALQAGSPAIDAGPAAGCGGDTDGDGVPDIILPVDQRGVPRNGPCDLGAYEF